MMNSDVPVWNVWDDFDFNSTPVSAIWEEATYPMSFMGSSGDLLSFLSLKKEMLYFSLMCHF